MRVVNRLKRFLTPIPQQRTMSNTTDLVRLAQKLVADGPHKSQHTPRRVRGLFNGKYAFDTTKACHVWEHPNYPQFYVPVSCFTSDASLERLGSIDGTKGAAHLGRLTVGTHSTDRVVIFSTSTLKDLVKVDFTAIDQWFEEDVPIFCHPKDPYKRIDILQSTRSVKVAIDGITLAETSNPLFLLETTLRTRYYLPPTNVKWEYLVPSDMASLCPYKGRANYYHVKVNGKIYKDIVWYYRYPTPESAPVAGHLCFYNEMVDIWVDGEKEEN
ncbi:hypothetical protein HBH98_230720 [Parastagonospora nodorum]|nr:hypothetical protein HBH49_236300 [Parastagonospora nodorum]KAH4336246.1 hypothetical protein HBH98_230720 [Parastagonospora nodorum]KAH4357654.1 hypothetical protein HBH97_221910 [Parastagonospora nodorum]KAH5341023.1 hypothetical protein HBI48_235980 [Parastagonospora nodorum]KAH5485464.1 hypothetical protein HBI29_229760 [Parastagonospora nodorum]